MEVNIMKKTYIPPKCIVVTIDSDAMLINESISIDPSATPVYGVSGDAKGSFFDDWDW